MTDTMTSTDVFELRERLNIDVPMFAAMLGMSQNVVRAWEAGVLLVSPKFSSILFGLKDALDTIEGEDTSNLVTNLIAQGGLFPATIEAAHKSMGK